MQNETEQKILEAAKSIFIQKGFAGARMQEIADKAEINKAMLHYYFRSKRKLFEGIVSANMQIMAPKLSAVLNANGTVYHKLCLLVDTYIDTIIQNPDMPMFLLHEMAQGNKDSIEKMKQIIDDGHSLLKFMDQMREEQEKGILKPIPPSHIMLTTMSLIVFPFIARPIFERMLEIPSDIYIKMMSERKQIVKEIIKSSFMN
ncbi:TetR/AcrR family transcriptional regulator [Ulvibacterium sp.]|uniref:TetR/AcrR family transcriptional regulator n=1 Tax=Ulvibacterium sp. TaxID=2665914 RepID=UPI0026062660|nr:TetR/AcrR family transcriptional regulator [Ulvibacterium sp.]